MQAWKQRCRRLSQGTSAPDLRELHRGFSNQHLISKSDGEINNDAHCRDNREEEGEVWEPNDEPHQTQPTENRIASNIQ